MGVRPACSEPMPVIMGGRVFLRDRFGSVYFGVQRSPVINGGQVLGRDRRESRRTPGTPKSADYGPPAYVPDHREPGQRDCRELATSRAR
jgi:hypothetical protein